MDPQTLFLDVEFPVLTECPIELTDCSMNILGLALTMPIARQLTVLISY